MTIYNIFVNALETAMDNAHDKGMRGDDCLCYASGAILRDMLDAPADLRPDGGYLWLEEEPCPFTWGEFRAEIDGAFVKAIEDSRGY